MDDLVLIILLGAILLISFVYLFKPSRTIQNQHGVDRNFERTEVNTPPPARAGHCKTIQTDTLTSVQKRLHTRLPRRDNVRPICLSGSLLLNASNELLDLEISFVSEILVVADVFLIFQVNNEDEKAAIAKRIAQNGVLAWNAKNQSGIPPHKILYCSTSVGKIAIVRQIEPVLHIEENDEVVVGLRPFIPSLFYVNTKGKSLPPLQNSRNDNLTGLPKFADYFYAMTN